MASEPAFTAQIESRNGVARVALRGELDTATAPLLEESLAPLESNGFTSIMLDLRDLKFLDSSGLRVLLAASERAETNGHRLLLVGATPGARRLFELTGTQFLIDGQAVGVLHRFAGNRRERNRHPGSDRDPRG